MDTADWKDRTHLPLFVKIDGGREKLEMTFPFGFDPKLADLLKRQLSPPTQDWRETALKGTFFEI